MRAVLILLASATGVGAATNIPLFFVANQGRFMAKSAGFTAYFQPHTVDLKMQGASLHLRFEGSGSAVRVEGASPQAGRANFLIGAQSQWRRDVPTFGAVLYRELYPCIDMIYGASGAHLKSEFRVKPCGDPTRIRIRYTGASKVAIAPDGSLAISVGGQTLTEAPPSIYQERNGVRSEIEGHYALRNGAVSFALGVYDPFLPLVIDPLLTYSTLIGRNNFNAATSIAVDSTGAAYIAGYTDSSALPTANPAQNFNLGSVAVFVAKLNPDGTAIEYCTYMGGSDDDRAYGIAVDATGAAYVTGTTTSPDFPTRYPEQSSLSGGRDAFVFKLNPMGDMLLFSTFLGGSGTEVANGIAIDSAGNSFIVGDTTSLNFPAAGYQTANHGSQDAFVARLSASGQQLVSSTYLGGSSADHGGAIAIDSNDTVYITGYTWSRNFPLSNAFPSSLGGPCNAYIAHLSANFNSLVFSSYLGGSGCTMAYPETGQGIVVDAQNNIYVAGVTSSVDFPQLNALQPQLEGSTDVFVAKVNASGTLLFSTYMGGSGVDVGNAIGLDPSGAIYVVGYTYSDDFPVTTDAVQTALGGACDAFLFKLTPAGDTLLYATYLGGSGNDTASGIAFDSGGNVYLSGWTLSGNFPVVHN